VKKILTALVMGALPVVAPRPALAVDPMDYIGKPPLGLPAVPSPKDNPITRDKAELGRALYFDPRLSIDGSISCASCHNPGLGWSNGMPVAAGFLGQKGGRSAPVIYNAAYNDLQFWDGRAATLEAQIGGPMQNPIEMGPQKIDRVAARLNLIPGYRSWFQKVFAEPATAANIPKAIATYERTILSGNAPVDRFQAGDKNALSAAAARGWELFKGKARCTQCHVGFNFNDNDFHNIGVGMSKPKPDLGRYDETKKAEDKGKFKTPTLREITESGPFMHDGSQKTLEEVVDFYNKGGEKNPTLDKEIKPLDLTAEEKADLVAFLKEGLKGEHLTIVFPDLPK
jgi:cytochrome c peroxidase